LTGRDDTPGRVALRRALLDSARVRRQEQLTAGFVHDLNGPLNNFSLTLSLLEAALARARTTAPQDAMLARCARHVELLQAESRKLQAWSREMAATLIAPAVPEPRADVEPLLAEVQRMLRHHAVLHEVTLDVAHAAPLPVRADAWSVRLALLDCASALVVLAAPGSTLRIRAVAGDAHVRVGLHAVIATWPAALDHFDALAAQAGDDAARALAALVQAADDDEAAPAVIDLAAASCRVESQGGSARIAHDRAQVQFTLELPLA
jgi:hypothetical protein